MKYVVFVEDLDTKRVLDIYGPSVTWEAAHKVCQKLRKKYPTEDHWVGIRILYRYKEI